MKENKWKVKYTPPTYSFEDWNWEDDAKTMQQNAASLAVTELLDDLYITEAEPGFLRLSAWDGEIEISIDLEQALRDAFTQEWASWLHALADRLERTATLGSANQTP